MHELQQQGLPHSFLFVVSTFRFSGAIFFYVLIVLYSSGPPLLYLIGTFLVLKGYAVVQLVEALHYKPEGRGFYS